MKGNLDVLLLAVLATAPAHGYEAALRLRRRSDGTFDLPEGTIYPALHRLEAKGWLNSSWVIAEGRRRRVYALTGLGKQQLAMQRREWAEFTAGMTAVLGAQPV